jgi:hypothetical protein
MAQGPGGPGDGQPVWDGTTWVVPGTPWRWDGTAWVDTSAGPAPPGAAAATWEHATLPRAATPPIGAGTVFVQVFWRALTVAVVGGAAAGFVGTLALAATDPEDGAFLFAFVVALVGGVFGVLLGLVAGPVMGGICAWRLVPYPGARSCTLLARALAIGFVALFLPLLFWDAVVDDNGTVLLMAGISAMSLAGAWFGGGWTIRWYVRRMDGAQAAP